LGVSGFVLGVVVTVGYRPTGSSDVGKPPLGGTNPSTKHPSKAGVKGCGYAAFSMVVTYTAN